MHRISLLVLLLPAQINLLAQANSNASPLCGQILQYLKSLTTDCKIIYSQDLGHVDNITSAYTTYVTALEDSTGVLLPMIGGDYGLGSYDMNAINATLANHWNQQKFITLSWHLPNPWTSGDSWDVTNQDKLVDLIDFSKPVSAVWRSQLDEIATVLQDLKSRGVVVLWRPLHEANGYWFWWGHPANSGAAASNAFKALWQDMFTYFSINKGLDNLLWVYSAGEGQFHNPTDFCYPGNEFVDIVGIDLYRDDLSGLQSQDFQNLIDLNKVFAITEFGPDIPNDPANYDYTVVHSFIKNNYPEVAYLHAWHSWQHSANEYHHNTFVENLNANQMLNDVCHQSIDPFVFDLSTNAYEVGSNFISIYPNPVPNQLKVEGILSAADIRIFNAQGQLIHNLNGMTSPITIDLAPLVSGPYFLSIANHSSQQVETFTMIKE